ncbi:protein phosphatase 1F-like [Symsagittifera roscoffensis]|uniref:protein phosphatase 1F-like n=1 Tax=Symsagittifera roscoffensis TaxID=84072 RepID=UPI00307BA651
MEATATVNASKPMPNPQRLSNGIDDHPLPDEVIGGTDSTQVPVATDSDREELVVHVKSVQGRRKTMEDRYLVLNNFQPNIFNIECIVAVFDGHGGSDASQFCQDNFQTFFMRALLQQQQQQSQRRNSKSRLKTTTTTPSTTNDSINSISDQEKISTQTSSASSGNNAFQQESSGDTHKGNSGQAADSISESTQQQEVASRLSVESSCESPDLSNCLRETFLAIDEAFARKFPKSSCGSTAIVVAVDRERSRLDFANVGDSAATVLRRNRDDSSSYHSSPPTRNSTNQEEGAEDGTEVVLLNDIHNTENESEEARIVGLGGFVFAVSGTTKRVNGCLTITRAIGDLSMKEVISAEPETETYDISPQDRFLLLASDGFFDAVPFDELGAVMDQVTQQVTESGGCVRSCNLAELLCEEALRRDNSDNITVLCVPLK